MRFRGRVGACGEPHVVAPICRGPDLLAVDHPAVAVADRPGAERREVGARTGLAVPHAVDDLAVGDLRQAALLLLQRAVDHPRSRLDRRSGARRVGAGQFLHQRQQFVRRAFEPAELLRPGQRQPAGRAQSAGEAVIVLAMGSGFGFVGGPSLRRPVLGEPLPDLAAEGVAFRAEIEFGRAARRGAEIALHRLLAGAPAAAMADDVEICSLEMARRLMVLGIADRTEGVMRLQETCRRWCWRGRRPQRRSSAIPPCLGRNGQRRLSSSGSCTPISPIRLLASLCWTAWKRPTAWPGTCGPPA